LGGGTSVTAPNDSSLQRAVATKVQIQQEWFTYSGFAGEVAAAKRFDEAEGVELTVAPGSESIDPIKVVMAGTADLGVASADLVLGAIDKGAPLIVVGTVNHKSPTCFLVRAGSGIRGPLDFPGHKVGILTGTNTERIYALMMKRAHVDRTRVSEVPIPFELQTFVLGQYDVRPAFAYDEPVSLTKQRFAYSTIYPENFGVEFVGTVYFARKDFVEKNAKTVQGVVNALVQGWSFAIAHPEDAVSDLIEYDKSLDRERETSSLKMAKDYFAGENGRPLTATSDVWERTIFGLVELSVLSRPLPLTEVLDNSFVTKAYAAK
jgi:ABC-type nitrate/sulfonate/bicarbonate transport system substrate-binding protein